MGKAMVMIGEYLFLIGVIFALFYGYSFFENHNFLLITFLVFCVSGVVLIVIGKIKTRRN